MSATYHTLDALYAAGYVLVERHRPLEALALFRTMLLVDARDERGWLALGTCHERLDEPEKALAIYEVAATACAAVRCTIARARLHRSRGERREACEAYEHAARLAEEEEPELVELITREGSPS